MHGTITDGRSRAADFDFFRPAVAAEGAPNAALVPPEPWGMRVGKRIQPIVNRIVARSSRVADRALPDARDFPWVAVLEREWRTIRDEATAALADLAGVPPLADISPDHRDIAPGEKWRSLFLYGYGYRDDANCRACPQTAALVAGIPELNSAFFSVLAPGARIPPHVGVTKALMTCHLGTHVPDDADSCRMRVGHREVVWREGEAILFDDTVEHEVLNATDEPRVVLLIQFRRPVGWRGRLVGGAFLWAVKRSRFVQDARAGVARWAAKKAK